MDSDIVYKLASYQSVCSKPAFYLKDLGVDWRIILEWILEKKEVMG
jgi:hypothetical protein